MKDIVIANGGTSYGSAPTLTFSGGGGTSNIINFLPGSFVVGSGANMSDVRQAANMGVQDALRAKGTA